VLKTTTPTGNERQQLTTVADVLSIYESFMEQGGLFHALVFGGVMSQQVPNDGVVITDLIGRVRPDLVIELGTAGGGGSVQWAAAMRRYSASARLLTIDPASDKLAGTPLTPWNFHWGAFDRCPHCVHLTQTPEWAAGTIRFVRELPTSSRALAIAHEAASKNQVVLVIEDSDHQMGHVLSNLEAYAGLVSPGSYYVVQDTRLGGPLNALHRFLKSPLGRCFRIDRRLEYLLYTQHHEGYLYRLKGCSV